MLIESSAIANSNFVNFYKEESLPIFWRKAVNIWIAVVWYASFFLCSRCTINIRSMKELTLWHPYHDNELMLS